MCAAPTFFLALALPFVTDLSLAFGPRLDSNESSHAAFFFSSRSYTCRMWQLGGYRHALGSITAH